MALAYVLNHLWNHRSNQGRRATTLCRAVGWQLRKRVNPQPVKLDVYHGLQFLCYPDSCGSSVMIYSNGWPDFDDMYFVSRYLRPGDSVIDVGANIGIYTLLTASVVGPTGRVLAFEPGACAFEILAENIQSNDLPQVELRREVLGSKPGQVRFLKNLGLTNRLVADDEQPDESSVALLNSTTLDDELQSPFAFGKIDVEGAEPIVFEGAANSLRSGNPTVWLMEFKDRLLKKFGWSATEFAEVIRAQGYQLGVYDAQSNELTFPANAWADHDNVLAVFEPAVDDVKQRLAEASLDVPGAPR